MCASTATAIGHMPRLCSVHRTTPVSVSMSDLKSRSRSRTPTSPHGMAYCCMQLARFSLMRAAERIAAAKRQRADPDADQGAEERASEEGVRAVRASCRMSAQCRCSSPVWCSDRQSCSYLL